MTNEERSNAAYQRACSEIPVSNPRAIWQAAAAWQREQIAHHWALCVHGRFSGPFIAETIRTDNYGMGLEGYDPD